MSVRQVIKQISCHLSILLIIIKITSITLASDRQFCLTPYKNVGFYMPKILVAIHARRNRTIKFTLRDGIGKHVFFSIIYF
jgi:hypothetical protein